MPALAEAWVRKWEGEGCSEALRDHIRQSRVVYVPYMIFETGAMDWVAVKVVSVIGEGQDRKSTRLNSSHSQQSRMPSSA